VKWKDGDLYGIGFNRAFRLDELMGFLREQQDERRRAAAG
jgi:hypothetical protein